jgi:glycerol-3-phosphate dehydrogenase (NAD(P)+)
MNFTLLGCGRWGSFIAWYLDKNKNNVTVWGREGFPEIENLMKTRTNEYVTLPESIKITTDLEGALDASEYIIISISSQAVRELMTSVSQIQGYKDKIYILCMKGIEETTGNRLSTILIEFGVPENNIAVWVGPGHIQSFVKGIPSVMIIDAYNSDLSLFLAKTLRSDLIRFYQGEDIIGSEIGAASKNVMGIAAGLLDGMGYSSLKGGLMARGAREISRLIKACGGNELSAYGLCHLGDYEATLFSKFSHNRMWGESFAKGEKFDKLAEGVATSSALLTLAKKVGVELPITKTVYDVIHQNITKDEAIKKLFARENIKEF